MKLTGSKLDLADACPASMALPWTTDEGGEPAGRGIDTHAVIEAIGKGKTPEEALLLIDAKWRPAAKAMVAALPVNVLNGVPEMSIALDPFAGTARFLGQSLGRNYPTTTPDEVILTIDWYGLMKAGLLVIDWKTGQWMKRAGEALQVLAAAWGLSILHKRPSAVAALVYLREDEDPVVSSVDLDAFALDEIRERLKRVVGKVARAEELVRQGQRPDIKRGSHCRFCPAYDSCPGTLSLVKSLSSGESAVELAGYATIDPARMPAVYRRMREYEDLLKRIKEQIHHYALSSPIPLEGGMVYGPVKSSRESVDGNVVYRVLRERYGQEYADAACSTSSSKTAIKEAAKLAASKIGGKIAPVEKEMLDAVRLAGGLTTKVTTIVKEHLAK